MSIYLTTFKTLLVIKNIVIKTQEKEKGGRKEGKRVRKSIGEGRKKKREGQRKMKRAFAFSQPSIASNYCQHVLPRNIAMWRKSQNGFAQPGTRGLQEYQEVHGKAALNRRAVCSEGFLRAHCYPPGDSPECPRARARDATLEKVQVIFVTESCDSAKSADGKPDIQVKDLTSICLTTCVYTTPSLSALSVRWKRLC